MFIFKLQSVLNYRKAVEEKRLLEFFEEKKRLAEETKRLEQMRCDAEDLLDQLRKKQFRILDSSEIALCLSYIKHVMEKEHIQEDLVTKVNDDFENKKGALLEAVKNRKIMDTLKEKKFQSYKENIAAFERKTDDETAMLRFARKEK